MAFQITGIRKPGGASNPHEAISHYRWQDDNGTSSGFDERMTVVSWVKDKKIPAYVASGFNRVACGVRRNEHGTEYLQTYANKVWSDNLLSLPEV